VDVVSVHIVSGAPRSGKSAWIARHAEAHPDWLGFVNTRTKDLPNLLIAPLGCPCCTARVAMQVALARQLRKKRLARVYIELPDPRHAVELDRALREWPLSQYVAAGEAIELP
jgi:hypothetical protein